MIVVHPTRAQGAAEPVVSFSISMDLPHNNEKVQLKEILRLRDSRACGLPSAIACISQDLMAQGPTMYMNATKSTDLLCNKLPLKQFHLHRFNHPAREVDRQPSYPARPLARPGAIRHYLSSPLQRNPSRCCNKKFQLHQLLRHLQECIISPEHALTINAVINATGSAQNRNKLHLERFTQDLPPA